MLSEIHDWVESTGKKPWQVYLLGVAVLSGAGLYFDTFLVSVAFQTGEQVLRSAKWLVLLSVQGVLIGFAAEFLYEQDTRYAKSGSNRFGSKDRILVFRVGVMTVASGVVTIAVPALIEQSAAYPTVQMVAAALTLGIVLVHCSSGNWKLRTEWPAVVGGMILTLGPSVL